MEIATRAAGRVDVLQVRGPIRARGHEALRMAVMEALERRRGQLVINLSDTASLDSMALGELVACLKRVREVGGEIKLVVRPDGVVHGMLQLTKLDGVFEIFGDENQAAASFSSGLS
jgi:anti-anti-sigma factor